MPFSQRLQVKLEGIPLETSGNSTPRYQEELMQAAVLNGPKDIQFPNIPIPVPDFGQVRIRLEGCGVCASNIPVWEGRPWFEYPLPPGAPGHEGWGLVDAAGPGVDTVAPGDRVAVLSDGAFAQYDLAEADAVVKLPAELDGLPFPGEPLGCAMNVFNRSDIQAGQIVAVVGVGFLGALLVRLAKNAGATVIAVSRRPFACEVARGMGADKVYQCSDSDESNDVIDEIRNSIGSDGCDRVIEATGLPEPLEMAAELVRVRGKLIIAGYHQDGRRSVNFQLWNWKGIDVINAHERSPAAYVEGMRQAVRAVVDGQIDPLPLLTHRFTLAELPQALETARERPDGFLKASVLMD